MRSLRQWSFTQVLLASVAWLALIPSLGVGWLYLQFRGSSASGSGGIGAVSSPVPLFILLAMLIGPIALIPTWRLMRLSEAAARDRAAFLILSVAAVLATMWTIVNVWQFLMLPPLLASYAALGAVAGGLAEAIVETALWFGLLLVNWLLSGPARRHGLLATRFQRTHLWLTVAYFVASVVFGVALAMSNTGLYGTRRGVPDYGMVRVFGLISASLLPLQLFFAGSVCAFLIGNPGGYRPFSATPPGDTASRRLNE